MADAIITGAGMRVLKLLVGTPPKTVGELIRETGVTRTAVTEQLSELVAGGFASRAIERLPGRGRPRHLFTATKAAMVLLFANNQQLVVPAIWKAISEIGGEGLTEDILHRVSRSLAKHYEERITASDPRRRISQFKALLEEEGGLIDLKSKDGQVTVMKRTCAFISMSDEQRHVCKIDLEVIATIARCPVRVIACRHDGASCCKLEIDTRAVNGTPSKRRVAQAR
jgi:predicted ArsR family transcriptional regulator